ncbi:tetratricopeptide repeat protein [Catellatospora methionotrophica]|uniref:tetratricopeptide repeat protein n=1 Tax=Catellatospora methionotrophica TaxID=121620 RepID=UPI001EF29B3A|nr:tetratricopeptide repeat protein [Catellatospora methionotrophica]
MPAPPWRVPGVTVGDFGSFDCHRERGPYAGVDAFLARIAPAVRPRLVARHQVELFAVAPRLDPRPPAQEQPIRFHPARRTACLAYGVAEFVAAWAQTLSGPATVRFEHTAEADETTVELLHALTARLDGGPLRLILDDGGTVEPPRMDTAPDAIRTALGDSLARGFYHHAQRLAQRGRDLLSPQDDLRNWWAYTTGLATALSALDRADEALRLYDQTRMVTDDRRTLMSAAYSTAMLYARHLRPDAQDQSRARDWLEQAITLAAGIEDPKQRLVTTVFYEQGIALLDSRAGEHARALRLVDDGLSRLEGALAPGERPQDVARLYHNRAQVHLALGDRQRAMSDLDRVVARDPGNSEYYIDRAALHRAAGRTRAASRDYDEAIRLGPHLPEAYYNRAVIRQEQDRPGLAAEDFGRALAIDPGHLDARVALVNLHLEQRALDRAEAQARDGLAVLPDEPVLLCTLGLVRSEHGDLAGADALLTLAVTRAPELVEAWTNRAAVRFEQGDVTAALADLDRAVALSQAPVPLYNRGAALARLGRWDEAVQDLTVALAQPELDRSLRRDLRAELTRCRRAAARR